MRHQKTADVMLLARWETMKRMLHISDNSCSDKCTDRIYKIPPLIDAQPRCAAFCPARRCRLMNKSYRSKGSLVCVSTIRRSRRNRDKRCLCCPGSTDWYTTLRVYTGKIDTCLGQPDLKPYANIVLRLIASIPRMRWYKVFFDNWFTSTDLQVTLWMQGIACVGTVRGNRLSGCKMPEDKVLCKKGRGAMVLQTTMMDSEN